MANSSPKADHPQIVPLPRAIVEKLRRLERVGPYVIPGRDWSRPRSDLRKPWLRIRETAGIQHATIHDLRRTFGLHVAQTKGLHIASKLLRHSDIRVTERVYAPLGIEDLQTAVNEVNEARVLSFGKIEK